MTLQQKRVRPITLLFEVGFYNYLTEMITVLRLCVRTILHFTKTCYLNSQFQWSTEEGMCPFGTYIVFYLKVKL